MANPEVSELKLIKLQCRLDYVGKRLPKELLNISQADYELLVELVDQLEAKAENLFEANNKDSQ